LPKKSLKTDFFVFKFAVIYRGLALKHENETIHPLGSWVGIYFTEELKAAAKYGYKIELIKLYHD
jgi:hypothetical protein